MVEMGLRLVLAGVLAGAAISKLANPSAGREALAGFGFESPTARTIGFWSLIAIELGLAAGLVAGSTEAAILGAGLMAMFGLVMARRNCARPRRRAVRLLRRALADRLGGSRTQLRARRRLS